MGLAAPVLVLSGTFHPVVALAHPVVAGAGLTFGVVGLVVVLLAQCGHQRPVPLDPQPGFTGMAAVATGVVLMVATLIALAAWPPWSRQSRSRFGVDDRRTGGRVA
ncbi:MAG: hypothetical protein ACRDPK_07985 [Carbonactinosporaceae bacterium]